MNKIMFSRIFIAMTAVLFSSLTMATTGGEFQTAYDFINDAATGYLGRSIAIAGGLIGLGMGAASGKALPAVMGVVLAMFGAMGPAIIDSIFASGALI